MYALDLPAPDTCRLADQAVRAFYAPDAARPPTHIERHAEGEAPVRVTLPPEAAALIEQLLTHLAQGHGVTILPVPAELSTQQAANLLQVSRPFIVKLMDEGHLPSRKVGTHRRVRLDDLLAWKRLDEARRREAADQLAAEAQALGLGY